MISVAKTNKLTRIKAGQRRLENFCFESSGPDVFLLVYSEMQNYTVHVKLI